MNHKREIRELIAEKNKTPLLRASFCFNIRLLIFEFYFYNQYWDSERLLN
jgi:hypothetical protein